tara:strand:- start:19440 stop:20096 length:657 start_codon:yes stop_codon:yes gene_type:complete
MSYRTTINKVLIRLREDTISADWVGALNTSTTLDPYEILIGELVNEAKEVVEDAWNWGSLRTLETVNTEAATATYTMSNLDSRARVLQIIDTTNDLVLTQISDDTFYRYTYLGTPQTGQPTYYRLSDNKISFYPTPAAAYAVVVHATQPQSDLTTASSTLTVAERLVVLGAYSLALNERGEDGGTLSDTAAQRFNNALVDAISQDELRTVNETTWYAS